MNPTATDVIGQNDLWQQCFTGTSFQAMNVLRLGILVRLYLEVLRLNIESELGKLEPALPCLHTTVELLRSL